jgi:hypothetical protein
MIVENSLYQHSAKNTVFCTNEESTFRAIGFIWKSGFKQFSAQTIQMRKSHASYSCFLLGGKVIFYELQLKLKFSYCHLQILEVKKCSCLQHRLSEAETHLEQRTDKIQLIKI